MRLNPRPIRELLGVSNPSKFRADPSFILRHGTGGDWIITESDLTLQSLQESIISAALGRHRDIFRVFPAELTPASQADESSTVLIDQILLRRLLLKVSHNIIFLEVSDGQEITQLRFCSLLNRL